MQLFKLDSNFISEFQGKQPKWGPLGYVTYKRTYARPVEGENRTEEWWETVRRVVEGTYQIQQQHCHNLKLRWDDAKAQRSAQTMYKLIWDFKFLPPGRGLQMMGTPMIGKIGNAALQNCAFVSTEELSTDFAEPFCFMMDMSMLGVGVGADMLGVQEVEIWDNTISTTTVNYTIPDTREGWVEAVRLKLNSFIGGPHPYFDYSEIRPYGTPIKGMGGTASGAAPLRELIENINTILLPLIFTRISTTAIADIFNAIGRCVVSGNVRRSAQILFGDPYDYDFMELKDPTLNEERMREWGWASNNSVIVQLGQDYSDLVEQIKKNGEPGFLWLENARRYGRMDGQDRDLDKDWRVKGSNPCGEISLESYEFCTLSETFPANHTSMADWLETLKYAYLYAKTVTLIPSHNMRSNAVMLRNRRIGVSQSGIVQAVEKFGIQTYIQGSREGYILLQGIDETYSEWLCVPKSIKLTTVKPSGTVSLLCGATPGIHYPQSQYYWRTMRFDSGSPILATLRAAGYKIVIGEGHNTSIVYFPVRERLFGRSVKDVTIWEQTELAAQLQAHWADNQVSVTVNFQPHEADSLVRVLELYERRLKSVSFLPYTDHQYEHAPYQPISEDEYYAAIENLKPLEQVLGMDANQLPRLFCDGDSCEVK